MKKKVFLISFLLIVLWAEVVGANNTKIVLFVMDGVSLQELQQSTASNYQQLLTKGAVGLMNVRTADDLEPIDTYLTIGSGNRARGGFSGRLSFNSSEKYKEVPAVDVYQSRIRKLKDSVAIVNLSLAKLIKANQSNPYHSEVGNLGDKLGADNLKIAVLGNADTRYSYRRQVALLGINKYGIINQGDIGHQTVKTVSQYPSNYLTNQSYLLSKLDNYLNNCNLVIIESGDTSRVEKVKNDMIPLKFKTAKQKAIRRVDNFLGKVINRLDFTSDYLIIIAPTPAKEYIKKGYKLSWGLAVGPDIKSGLLTSGTTKQIGLITNLDISPTIYSYLVDDKQQKFTGQKIASIVNNDPINYLNNLNEQIRTIFSWRPLIVKVFIALQIIIILLAGGTLIFKYKSLKVKRWIIYVVLMVNWLPVFFIFSIFFSHLSLVNTILIWIISSFAISYYIFRFDFLNKFLAILIPDLIIISSLIIDLWTGGRLLKVSILGYSPVVGARYYGIGNEYMGLLIGTTIVVVTLFFELKEKIYRSLLFLISVVLIITVGLPSLGSNFGGLISATITCSLTYFYLEEYNLNLKSVVKSLAVVMIVVGIIVLFDIYNGAQSHVARLVLRIKNFGIDELFTIIYRKVTINLRLLQWTIWTKVLLAFVFILVVLFRNPRGLTAALVSRHPYFSSGFKALLWGSLIAGLVNDSGVVVVATLLLVPVFTLIYLVFLQINLEKEGNNC